MKNILKKRILYIRNNIISKNVNVVAVSKKQKISSIEKLYKMGYRDFGENYAQEMIYKYNNLPKDIRWHMIGNIQSNKLKYIIPFVYLIHSIQKIKHIRIIEKIGKKYNKIIKCLLQIKISKEKKSGITDKEADEIINNSKKMKNIKIIGIMGIASFQEENNIEKEFKYLYSLYNKYKKKYKHYILSMGMSKDFRLAIKNGSTIIRLGTYLFGKRK